MGDVEVHALRGIDVSLHEPEFIVLLGPSGSGKSTLLNILGGLDVPTAGTVVYRGRNLTAAEESELTRYRRRHVGFVFQFYNLIPSLTAGENVALVTDIAEDPLTPEEALEWVDLDDRIDHALSAFVVYTIGSTELYRIPLHVAPATFGMAVAGVIVAAVVSSLVVGRRLNRLDLVAVLKTRE